MDSPEMDREEPVQVKNLAAEPPQVATQLVPGPVSENSAGSVMVLPPFSVRGQSDAEILREVFPSKSL